MKIIVWNVNFLGAAEPSTLQACCIIQMSYVMTQRITKVEDADQLVDMGYGFNRFCPLLILFSATCVMD